MKIYTFKVTYDDVDDLERIIELPENIPLSQLAYTILVTFNTALNHLYKIVYKGKIYDCGVMLDDFLMQDEKILLAKDVNILELDIQINDELKMIYDFGMDQLFNIEVIDIEERKNVRSSSFPKVISGKGKGIIDDVHSDEFKEIVRKNKLCKEGKWPYDKDDYFPYHEFIDFNFNQYSQSKNDRLLRTMVVNAQMSYECNETPDIELLEKWYGVFYSIQYGLYEYEDYEGDLIDNQFIN